MTTRYRVEYHLKSHRRDQFIEWVKGLLISPFVLVSQPAGDFEAVDEVFAANTADARRRYAEIMRDIEVMIAEHRSLQFQDNPKPSKLQLLVPTAGPFFTELPLEAAFLYQDSIRHISSRRLVAPSFNDIRLTLNTAQMMALTGGDHNRKTPIVDSNGHHNHGLQLVTFDGDLTLYEDGQNLVPDSTIISRILALLRHDINIGIVTAAGYDTADRYYYRLHGLLDAIYAATDLSDIQKHRLLVVGGEASFVFAYDASPSNATHLIPVDPAIWMPDALRQWPADDMVDLLDLAETTLRACVERMKLPAQILRKARAVGMIPLLRETSSSKEASATTSQELSNHSIPPPPEVIQMARESLEEVVLTVQRRLEVSDPGRRGRVPFCAFNGGRDVFVDIGDKSWGVQICQHVLLGRTRGDSATSSVASADGADSAVSETTREAKEAGRAATTLHVGDQFLSAGANDFRARRAATTSWVANPIETEQLLDELLKFMGV